METFETPDSDSPTDKCSFAEIDATGKIVKGDHFDPEAQAISQDFKRPPY
jgi:hypothetical protein